MKSPSASLSPSYTVLKLSRAPGDRLALGPVTLNNCPGRMNSCAHVRVCVRFVMAPHSIE